MISEKGVVARVDGTVLWVQTVKQSVCGRCVARVGCGNQLLNRLSGASPEIPVEMTPYKAYKSGDLVTIGIKESAILMASLIAYGVPLLGLLFAVVLADLLFPAGVVVAAIGGLIAGALVASKLGRRLSGGDYFQARLLDSPPAKEVALKLS